MRNSNLTLLACLCVLVLFTFTQVAEAKPKTFDKVILKCKPLRKLNRYPGVQDFIEQESAMSNNLRIINANKKPRLEFYKDQEKVSELDISSMDMFQIYDELEQRGLNFNNYNYQHMKAKPVPRLEEVSIPSLEWDLSTTSME